jgi:DnaK suppressor protein
MNQKQIAKLRDVLTGKQEDMEAEVARLKGDLSAMPYQMADLADQASLTSDRQLMLMRIQSLSDNLKNVRQALSQLNEGDYGICENCGEDIKLARLIARPSARFCVSCQEMMENQSSFAA